MLNYALNFIQKRRIEFATTSLMGHLMLKEPLRTRKITETCELIKNFDNEAYATQYGETSEPLQGSKRPLDSTSADQEDDADESGRGGASKRIPKIMRSKRGRGGGRGN